MSLVSSRLSKVKPSPTLAVSAKAAELKKQGIDIISLGAGEPDFDTPDNIKQAAIKGIKDGVTKYTAASGTAELKDAICKKFKRENNLSYEPAQIIVGSGAKQVLYNLFMATLDEGDEVIIPAPFWVSYPDMVLLAGGTPITISSSLESGFKINLTELESAITKKTKWFILNSPSNPTGATYTEDELKKIASVLVKHPHVQIVCDDIYEHITFEGFKFKTIAEVAPELKDRTFVINGVSKAYSMTGWRIGYGAGNIDIIKAMTLIQSQSTSNPCSISQVASVEALNGPQDYIKINAKNFQKKRDLVLANFDKIPGLSCYKSEGAFYLFPKCSDLFGKKAPSGKEINSSNDLATYLIEEANVAVVPGIAFGLEGYFRVSYATSEALLQEACDRMAKAIMQLK